ncbi:MAG: hypothetical protein ACI3Z7_07045 [Candidatus Aphodosoma sp.]
MKKKRFATRPNTKSGIRISCMAIPDEPDMLRAIRYKKRGLKCSNRAFL